MEPPSTPRKPRRAKTTSENAEAAGSESSASAPKKRMTKAEGSTAAKPKTTKPSTASKKPAVPAAEPIATPPTAAAIKPPASPAPTIREDEPEIFKPLPAQPAKSSSAPSVVSSTSTSSTSAQESADRYMKLLRTWTVRNVEVVRKSIASAAAGSSTTGNKPASSLDDALDRFQKQLESNDSTVLISTLVFIIVCMVFTLLLSAAFR